MSAPAPITWGRFRRWRTRARRRTLEAGPSSKGRRRAESCSDDTGGGMMRLQVDPVDLLRTRFPALEVRDVRIVENGWDSLVLDLDGEWIFRFPRRPEVEQWMECEIALLPELAATLPVAVPRFEFVARNGVVCVGHRKLAGVPASANIGERGGEDLGRFLSALHRFPVERARAF